MKKLLIIAATLLLAGTVNAKVVEKTFTVRGHCGMCKNRIETVAKGIEGVQEAAYDLPGQSLRLVYDTKKTSSRKVLKSIAAVGYDAGRFKAPQEAYDSLKPCCRYREIEGIANHEHGEGHMHGEGHQHAE
ncbi:MAG: heavy-metal-associated domain-containing protein [Bacteroidales bacterium]|nr:heavy-metal-associated domain-containing protein [Bacteroidales bacterium]